MTEEHAFLQKLLESDDDSTMLMYIDWLKERERNLGRYAEMRYKMLRGGMTAEQWREAFNDICHDMRRLQYASGKWNSYVKSSYPEFGWEWCNHSIFCFPKDKLLAAVKRRVGKREIFSTDNNDNVIWKTADGAFYSNQFSIDRHFINRINFISFLGKKAKIEVCDLPEELINEFAMRLIDYKFDYVRPRPAGEAVFGSSVFVYRDRKWARVATFPPGDLSYVNAKSYLREYLTGSISAQNDVYVGVVVTQESVEKYKLKRLLWLDGRRIMFSHNFLTAYRQINKMHPSYFYDYSKFNLDGNNLRKLVGGV